MKRYWWEFYDKIWEEAKREDPKNVKTLFQQKVAEVEMARANKAETKGSRYYNPLLKVINNHG